jgi:TolB-like protein
VIAEDNTIHGDGVNIAARLEKLAEPGGVCIGRNVYDQVKGKLGYGYCDLGEKRVHNIPEPVHAYRVTPSKPTGDSPGASTKDLLPLPSKPSIAVLAFENMSSDPEQRYFSDGMSEDIITDLSKISALFVIARNSSFAYRSANVSIQEIGRQLGVQYVLEGSVRRAGNHVRITAQLVDAVSGGHLWAERYDRGLTDIFLLQDEITKEIVSNLALVLTAEERQRLGHEKSTNFEAYERYLRGAELLWRFNKEACAGARHHFDIATKLDPKLAPAWALLSHSHLLDYVNSWTENPDQSLEWAGERAEHAVAQNSESSLAHWQLGLTLSWLREYDRAIAEQRCAITIEPNLATAYAALGRTLNYVSPSQEAVDLIEKAIRFDPRATIWLHFLGEAYFGLKKYKDAAAVLERRIIHQPDTDVSRILLAATYGHLGQADKGTEMWREALRINPKYSLERKRRILPYKNPADFERIVEGLRLVGLSV